MAHTERRYPHGIDLMTADEASRDGHSWDGRGTRQYAKRQANRANRRDWLTNRERRAVVARILF